MLLLLSMAIITSLALTLTLASSPLFLGTWIMLIALMTAFSVAITSSSWLGLMIFLVYVGGLLVMFVYFIALTPNLFLEGKTMALMTLLTLLLSLAIFSYQEPTMSKTLSTISQSPMSNLMLENMLAIISMALILFFALVAVVKLCSSLSAPLRPFS
uniref:NADH dehydrogenase subunit 6 n=1 Tax=Prionospio sp. 6 MH-2023 TaxID=3059274 RepID=A0AAU6QGI7_9ANNE